MALPNVGAKIDRDLVIATHPMYERLAQMYRFWRNAYTGGGGFQPKLIEYDSDSSNRQEPGDDDEELTYLEPYVREHSGRFKERTRSAYYPNLVKTRVVQPLTGFLLKQPPTREPYPTQVEEWLDDATRDGQAFDIWLSREGVPYAMVYGSLVCLVDADPDPDVDTQAEREAAGAQGPRLVSIHPDVIKDWSRDKNGHLQWIKYVVEVTNEDPLAEVNKVFDRYWFIVPEGWFFIDDIKNEKNLTQKELLVGGAGPWPDGMDGAPLAELKFFNGESVLQDIAPIARVMFNQLSESREQERGQAFAMLVYTCHDATELDSLKVGVGNAIPESIEAGGKTRYIAPQDGPLAHYEAALMRNAQWIVEMGGTASIFGAQAEAAATMAYRFQVTDRMLASMAVDLVQFEEKVAQLVLSWTNGGDLPGETAIKYDTRFDAVDLERQLAAANVLISDIGVPPVAEKGIMMQLLDKVWPYRSDEDEKKLLEWYEDKIAGRGADAVPTVPAPPVEGAPVAPQVPQVPDDEL